MTNDGGQRDPQNGFGLYLTTLMRILQLPEAAFTYQGPGTCPRARHHQKTDGVHCRERLYQGYDSLPLPAPLLFSPFLQFNSCTQNPAQRPERSRDAELHLHQGD